MGEYKLTDNVQMNRVMLSYQKVVETHPHLTFASFCRATETDYNRARLWLFRYKGKGILELRTGKIKEVGRTYKMKGRDAHKDIVNEPIEPVIPPMFAKAESKEKKKVQKVIGEVIFEIPNTGIKTQLKNVPVSSFNAILTAITRKYGKPTEIIQDKEKKKTS